MKSGERLLEVRRIAILLAMGSTAGLAAILPGCGEDTKCPDSPAPAIVIDSIRAYPDTATVGQEVYIVVDAQGEDLQYRWLASSGRILETDGPVALWQAPDEPTVSEITVVAFNTEDSVARIREVIVGQYRPRHEPTYSGAGYCGLECHDVPGHRANYQTWLAAPHAIAYQDLNDEDYSSGCAGCHTVGYRDLDAQARDIHNGGYDEVPLERLEGVQCESCHGPLADRTGEILPDHGDRAMGAFLLEVSQAGDRRGCGPCHESSPHPESRPYVTEWLASAHASSHSTPLQSGERPEGNDCDDCHTAQGFIPRLDPGAIENVQADRMPVGCTACHDPHSSQHPADLRAGYEVAPGDVCRYCHVDTEPEPAEPHCPQAQMLAGWGAHEYPSGDYPSTPHDHVIRRGCVTCHYPADSSHTFAADPQSCSACHPEAHGDDFEWSAPMREIDRLLGVLRDELDRATGADRLTAAYQNAVFNYLFVQADRSRGAHNYLYARAVLESAIEDFEPTGR